MTPLPPIFVAKLFRPLCAKLHELLHSLSIDEWHRPTTSSERCVKDIVAHLLDGSLRRLSLQRDEYFSPHRAAGQQQNELLVDFLNRLNHEWEIATRRLSPNVLLRMLEDADSQLAELFESLDPFATAIFPVAWAGEDQSLNWMDVGRDYTEKWHHSQQIFEATQRQSTIMSPDLFHPCLDIFLRALPFAFQKANAQEGDGIVIRVEGPAGGEWNLLRTKAGWRQTLETPEAIRATIAIHPITLWRLVTKRRSLEVILAAYPDIRIEGDRTLGECFLTMVAMMA